LKRQLIVAEMRKSLSASEEPSEGAYPEGDLRLSEKPLLRQDLAQIGREQLPFQRSMTRLQTLAKFALKQILLTQRDRHFAVTCLTFLFLAACSPPAQKTTAASKEPVIPKISPWFVESAAAHGLNFKHTTGHRTRYYMPEINTGGVGLLDYDNDGWLDIYLVNGGSLDPVNTNAPGNKLFHNLKNGLFEDVTERTGVAARTAYGMGCACADYDGDGYTDIYVNTLGGNILYHNNRNGTFTDVTSKAGVAVGSWSSSAAFFDYDNDGLLDLMVVNYLKWSTASEVDCFSRGGIRDYCSPLAYKAPSPDTLFHNRGDGTFENVTQRAGLMAAYGNGLGVATCDFDQDGRIDIFVANDAMPNQLWVNQGNGTFRDEALLRGAALNSTGMPRAGMGVAVEDLNNDGWFDIFVTHLVGEGNGLFINQHGRFTDTTTPKGPNAPSLPYTGFGVAFEDFDNDGELDLYIANGRVKLGATNPDPTDPYAEPNTLLRGTAPGEFKEIPQAGVNPPLLAAGRGMAAGDLDNDGKIDLVIVNKDAPVHFLRNVTSNSNHWVTLSILNKKKLLAHNAVVEIAAGGRIRRKQVQPNYGYSSSNDPRVHFGLGKTEQIELVRVKWPSGKTEEFRNLSVDRFITLVESGD
jgi:hypothetical protein